MYEELTLSEEHASGLSISPKRRMSEISQYDEDEKERKARLAKMKREKIMAQMNAMQKAFIQSNAQFMQMEGETEE